MAIANVIVNAWKDSSWSDWLCYVELCSLTHLSPVSTTRVDGPS